MSSPPAKNFSHLFETLRSPLSLTKILVAVCLPFLLIQCKSVGVNYATPSTSAPDSWTLSIQPHLDDDAACLSKWWLAFKDPVLNELIERTRKDNPDFRIAMQRIVEARAQRGVAYSTLLPFLTNNDSYSRVRRSEGAGPIFGPNQIDL